MSRRLFIVVLALLASCGTGESTMSLVDTEIEPTSVPADVATSADTLAAGSLPDWAASVLAAADALEVTSQSDTTVYATYVGAVDVIVRDVEDRFNDVRSFQMRERFLLAVPRDASSVVEVLFTPTGRLTWDVEARLVPRQGP